MVTGQLQQSSCMPWKAALRFVRETGGLKLGIPSSVRAIERGLRLLQLIHSARIFLHRFNSGIVPALPKVLLG